MSVHFCSLVLTRIQVVRITIFCRFYTLRLNLVSHIQSIESSYCLIIKLLRKTHGRYAKITIDVQIARYVTKRIMTAQNTISKDSGLRVDSLALYTGVRFVKQNLVSSESLLRIIVFKPHYPKFLVNYPFVPLTAFLDLSESVVWNESGTNRETRTNHESRTNQEHWNESRTPPPVENDPPPVEIKSHPLQWKLRA